MGHTFGVRVDGPLARGLWPPVGGGLYKRVVKGKVLKMDGPSAQGFLSLTGPLAPRVAVLPLCGNAYKISVTGFTFCVIRYDRHSADWLATLASPYPATPLDTPSV